MLFQYGLLHSGHGDVGLPLVGARQWLEEALAIFRRLGTKKDEERTEQVLTELTAV